MDNFGYFTALHYPFTFWSYGPTVLGSYDMNPKRRKRQAITDPATAVIAQEVDAVIQLTGGVLQSLFRHVTHVQLTEVSQNCKQTADIFPKCKQCYFLTI